MLLISRKRQDFQITDKEWTVIPDNISIYTHMHINMLYISTCIDMYVYHILSNKSCFSKKDPKEHGTEFPTCVSEIFLTAFK